MKLTLMFAASSIGLLALAAIPPRLAAQEDSHERAKHTRHYSVTDLGVSRTGTNSAAYDMNDIGWVAGSSNLLPGGPQHAFLWFGGGPLKDLGTLGGLNSAADGPNWFGEAPVISEIAKADPDGEDFCGFGTHMQCRGAIWRFGKLSALRSLPDGRNAVSIGINNLAQVVGVG